jgi:hypothetical protein
MAGWDVYGFVPDCPDQRPLRILGVNTVDLDLLPEALDPVRVHSLAVAPELYRRDTRIRARVLQAVDRGAPEVVLLGPSYPRELRREMTRMEHQCSSAAQVLKRLALDAAGGPTDFAVEREPLCSGAALRPWPADYAPRWRQQGAARLHVGVPPVAEGTIAAPS